MDYNFKANKYFKDILKSKEYLIVNQTSNSILESNEYKILFGNIRTLTKDNAFRGSKVILIKEDLLPKITAVDSTTVNKLFSNNTFATSDIIEINHDFEIIDFIREELPVKNNEARRFFVKLSNEGYLVFHVIDIYINTFISGEEFPESNFLSLQEKNKILEKKNIGQLNEVLESYRERLKDQPVYCKFFISKSHITSYHKDISSTEKLTKFITSNAHILNNKCEDKFREDLRLFLKDNLIVNVIVKEYILESKKRLDIFLVDDYGINFYLIEVKWVGESINPTGKVKSTIFKEKDINPSAVMQTLKYLEELDNKRENIVRAYLVVFDARKEDLPDTVENFDKSKLNEIQLKQYRKFEKIKDLRVKNFHPS
jgi:hypothetical protein